jgi:hypothetical protein
MENNDSASHQGGGREPVHFWGFKKPPPLRWPVPGFIPEGFVTVLAADGGTGKSYLALELSVCLALGLPFLGIPVTQRKVLYLDFELDEMEQKRRLWRVLQGKGVSVDDPRLQGQLFYYRPEGSLADPATHSEIVGIIEEHGIGLTVLDSLTIGSAGGDTTDSQDVIGIMQGFKRWGTVLAIDHLSKGAARGNQSQPTPFGSIVKRNIARSTATLSKAAGGGLILGFDKTNFGPKEPILGYEVEFDDEADAVRFRRVPLTHSAMAGVERHLDTYDTTLLAIEDVYDVTGEPVSYEEVAAWRADRDDVPTVALGTVRNHYTVLERRGAIVRVGEGLAVPADASDDEASAPNSDGVA